MDGGDVGLRWQSVVLATSSVLSTGPHEAEAQQQGSSKEREMGSCEVVRAASKGGVGSREVLFDSSFSSGLDFCSTLG